MCKERAFYFVDPTYDWNASEVGPKSLETLYVIIEGSENTVTTDLWLDSRSQITQILFINRYTLAFHVTFIKKLQTGFN